MSRDVVISPYGIDKETGKPKTPLPSQRKFHVSPKKLKAFIGGLGCGKTTAGCREVWFRANQYPGTIIVIARKTYMELCDTTRQEFFGMLAEITEEYTGHPGDIFDPKSCPFVRSFSKTENALVLQMAKDRAPVQILFRSLDAFEKFRSLDLGMFYIDEASEIVDENIFLTLVGRLRHPAQRGGYAGIVTSNPCDEDHWIFEQFSEEHKDRLLIQTPTSENAKNLPDDYEEVLRSLYSSDMVDRYILGLFGPVLSGKPVYPDFKIETHVSPIMYNPNLPIVRGWDFGFEFPACVICQIYGENILILEGIQGSNELINTFGARVKAHCEVTYKGARYEDYCDPAGNQKSDKSEKTSIEVLNGLKIFPQSYWQHVKDGILIINMMMQPQSSGKPAILIHPACQKLIKAFKGGYRYSNLRDKNGDLKPEKKNDHLADACRYVIGKPSFKSIWMNKLVRAKNPESGDSFNKARRRAIKARR